MCQEKLVLSHGAMKAASENSEALNTLEVEEVMLNTSTV